MAVVRHGPTNGCAHGPGCPHDIGPTQDIADYAVQSDVERRVLTAEELAARVTAAQVLREPRLHEHRPSAGMAVMRPAARNRRPVTPPCPEEDSVTTTAAPPELPCGTCLHDPVCGLKAQIPDVDRRTHVQVLDNGIISLVFTGVRVQCDHHLPQIALRETVRLPEPEPTPDDRNDAERAATSRQRGNAAMLDAKAAKAAKEQRYPLPRDRAERDRVVLAAVRSTCRLLDAGTQLGVSETRVGQILREIRAADGLPEDIAALLAMRNAAKAAPA